MNEHDNKYQVAAEDRAKDADFFGPAPAPAAPAAPAPATGAPQPQRTAPFPEAPSGYEFFNVPPGAAPGTAPGATPGAGTGAPPAPAGGAPGAQAPAPTPGAPTGPPSAANTVTPAPPPGYVPEGPPATGVAAGQPSLVQQPQQPASKSFADAMTAAVKDVQNTPSLSTATPEQFRDFYSKFGPDVLNNLREVIPQFVVGGRADFYKHEIGLLFDTGKAVEKMFPEGYFSESVTEREQAIADMRKKYGPSIFETIGDYLPGVEQPKTPLGQMARKAGEFVKGYRLPLGMLKSAGLGPMASSVVAGAISGFVGQAPDEHGLANMLKENLPASVGGPLSLLAVSPDDLAVVNRARHALENAGLGAIAEGIVNMVKAYRTAHMAKRAAEGMKPEAQAAANAEVANAKSLVDQAAPEMLTQGKLFELVEQPAKEALAANKLTDVRVATDPGVPAQVMAEAVARGKSLPNLKLNYEAILDGKADDVAVQLGNAMLERVSDAKRGVVTNKLTKLMADKMGMTPDDLLAKNVGEAWNATKIWGAAALVGQAEQDLRALAEVVRAPGSSVADGFAFRRMLTYYNGMLEQFMGVAGEAGRALQIFKAIHQTGILRQARAIQAVIDKGGGMDNVRALAQVVADAEQFNLSTIAKGWAATTAEGIRTTQIMNMLWRPATQVRNIVGNISMLAMAGQDVLNASRVGWFAGTPASERMTAAGAAANWEGQMYGIQNAFKAFAKSFRANESLFNPLEGGGRTALEGRSVTGGLLDKGLQKPDIKDFSAAERFAIESKMTDEQVAQFAESGFGQVVKYLAAGTTLPGRFLTATDDFFKTIVYSGKVRQNAVEEAARRGLSGKAFEDYVTKVTLNPPDKIHLDAHDWSMWATYNEPAGPISQGLMQARDAMGPLGYLTMPFIRTPGNVLKTSFEHTPLAALMPSVIADINKGGVARDLALGKMATGASMLSMVLAYAESGHLTNVGDIDPKVAELLGKHVTGALPHNQGLADAYKGLGVHNYALRFGDKWVGVNSLGFLSMLFTYGAELNDLYRKQDVRPDDYPRIAQHIGLAVGAVYASMRDQSYMQGFADIQHALDESAQGKVGAFENWFNRWLGTAAGITNIPIAGGLIVSTQKMWEPQPEQRQIFDVWSAIRSRLPELAQTLSPVRDRLGEPMPQPTWSGDQPYWGRLYDWFMPFEITKFKSSPLREEMVRMQTGLDRIDKVTSFNGVRVDFRQYPQVFDMLVRLAGNEMKDPVYGVGFHDYMNKVIKGGDPEFEGQHLDYTTHTDSFGETAPGTKMAYIKKEAERFKKMAEDQVRADAVKIANGEEVNGKKPDEATQLEYRNFMKEVQTKKQTKQAFETQRGGVVPPMEDWSYQPEWQPTQPKNYSRPPSQQAFEPPPKEKQNGSGGSPHF